MRVRHVVIFIKGKRLATMQDVDYTINTNDGQEMTDSGVVNTDGVTTTTVTANNLVPVQGVGIDVVEQALRKEDITLQLFCNGKVHVLKDARATQLQFRGEVANGRQTGSFSWQAGKPELTG